MASISWDIMQDIAKMRAEFKATNDFEGMHITHLAEDHADAISKRHLPSGEYLDALTSTLESVKNLEFTTEHEAEILSEILELADLYREMYA